MAAFLTDAKMGRTAVNVMQVIQVSHAHAALRMFVACASIIGYGTLQAEVVYPDWASASGIRASNRLMDDVSYSQESGSLLGSFLPEAANALQQAFKSQDPYVLLTALGMTESLLGDQSIPLNFTSRILQSSLDEMTENIGDNDKVSSDARVALVSVLSRVQFMVSLRTLTPDAAIEKIEGWGNRDSLE